MKKWKCTVCGYVHTGEEPPETCPVCGADRSMFVLLEDEAAPVATAVEDVAGAPAAGPRRWRCTVCGYVHTGEEPPETCPVCGADRSMFVEVEPESATKAASAPAGRPAAGPRKWKCSVCGYIHTGEEPPETCPVCGADRSMFVEVVEETAVAPTVSEKAAPPEPASAVAPADAPVQTPAEPRGPGGKPSFGRWDPWFDRLGRLHAHPIAVHIPNGVLPVSVGFLFLAALFDSTLLSRVALCNLIVVVFSMPVVLFTGWVDWQRRFGGHMTHVFRVKMICAAIVSATALASAIWMLIAPNVLIGPGTQKIPFLMLNLAMLAAAATAGFFGGKLVFRD